MKKAVHLLTFIICFLSASLNSYADEEKVYQWEAKAGFDLNVPSKWKAGDFTDKMYKPGMGFYFGGACHINLPYDLFITPELDFFYDSYAFHNLIITNDKGETVDKNPAQYKYGIRIPVVVGYHFQCTEKFAIEFFTGPEFRWAIGGKIDSPYIKGSIYDPLFKDFHRHCDLAWKAGFGFPIKHFVINFDAVIGLTDIIKGKPSMHENGISLGVAYRF